MFNWLKPAPLLEQSEQQWLLDTFLWAYEHFDGDYFMKHSQLVLPTNEFFSGRSTSVEQMASQVFAQVKQYAGLQQWPVELVAPARMTQQPFPVMQFAGRLRGEQAQLVAQNGVVYMSYNPQQINQPQDLIASFAQTFARVMVYQARQMPPGGEEFVNAATEVIASFFGFGVMLSNTVYQFRGGCGKCYNPYANRSSELSELQHVFLLALFCHAKGITGAHKHLKGHLRSYFKKATKEIKALSEQSADPLLLSLIAEDAS
ncbi:hypothetical protein AAEU32_07910 [Pseudoalteromonas sp. SSDWG2]|uniref:hypothetical protein n=1 Tax=Pseudoalteromonas sp. SSDWG2 TaxID=3139391 RepID=UPI003BAD13D7